MQYLLTEEEYDALNKRPKTEQLLQLNTINSYLREKVLRDANKKCIHDKEIAKYMNYCDKCPVICGENDKVDWKNHALLCTLPKRFSK